MPPEPAESAAPARPSGSHAETILVVDDNDSVRGLVCELLRQQGYEVLDAPNGPAALELEAKCRRRIDLLVVDIVMPSMPGTEVARLLAEQRPGIRVLYISGYADDVVADMSEVAAGSLLTKPFTADDVVRAVRAALDAPQRGRAAAPANAHGSDP
jgi:CheY-like chemotaxis protein